MSREFARPTAEQRTDAPYVADERTMLEGWLDFQRATLLWKCDGLSGEQLVERSAPPSTMSLLGLVRHMAEVERWWFRQFFAQEDLPDLYGPDGPNDADFDEVDAARAGEDFATFRAEVDAARAAAGTFELDDRRHSTRRDADISLRWVHVHMIEEYARHNGHADLLRERIDGVIGD